MSGYDVESMMKAARIHYEDGKRLLRGAGGEPTEEAVASATMAQAEFLAGALAVDLARYANSSYSDSEEYDDYQGGSRF